MIKKQMVEYILTQCPKEFHGKENWLGVKMSPHSPMIFINKVSADGVKTNEGNYTWGQCSQEIISTIYQRLKLLSLK